jgi:hypothetical protein
MMVVAFESRIAKENLLTIKVLDLMVKLKESVMVG